MYGISNHQYLDPYFPRYLDHDFPRSGKGGGWGWVVKYPPPVSDRPPYFTSTLTTISKVRYWGEVGGGEGLWSWVSVPVP
jgi:hypothetical protein